MSEHQGQTYCIVGGRLCLDFANSVDEHTGEESEERLHTYADLVDWAVQAGALLDGEARPLLDVAAERPGDAEVTLGEALVLREAIYRTFSAIVREATPSTSDLTLLNAALASALAHSRITQSDGGFVWSWEEDAAALDRPLWPVARSALDLLTSDDVAWIRDCQSDTCQWLFLDESRNHSRRWCDMTTCGNRAKARRHYARVSSSG